MPTIKSPNEKLSFHKHYTYTAREQSIFAEHNAPMYYRWRMYAPQLGRFEKRDPIGYEDGMNLYAYSSNNPSNAIDPTGLAEKNCGPGKMAKFIPQLWFNEACEKHDACYKNCSKTKNECDAEFSDAIKEKCETLPRKRKWCCNLLGSGYSVLADAGGTIGAYNASRKEAGCD